VTPHAVPTIPTQLYKTILKSTKLFRKSRQQFVPLSTTTEDGTIIFEIVVILEDRKIKNGVETKVAVRPDEANLQVGRAASKVWLTHGELYVETGALLQLYVETGGFTAAICGNGGLYCSYTVQGVNTL
jgi:hypothetical protein